MTFKENTHPIAVVVTSSEWNEVPRIRHQLTRQLMRFFNVIYVVKDLDSRKESIEQISERLIVYKPGLNISVPKRLYANDPLTHHLVNRHFMRKISEIIKLFGFKKIILVNFMYDFFEIMKCPLFDYKIYICYDEFPKMRRRKERPNRLKAWYQQKLFQCYENQVARFADKCLTQHYVLRDKLKKINANIEMFFPGHEFKNLLPLTNNNQKKPPVKVGYMGYVNYRIKKDWLLSVSVNKNMFLYLVGPLEKLTGADFKKFKNVKFIDSVFGEKLLMKLSEMDVLVMPYETEIEEVKILTINNKIFQYIAAGKPIVISNMPNYIEMPPGIFYRAKNAMDFVAKIRQAYDEDCDEYIKLRLKIASENSWDKRGNQLYEIIREEIPSLPKLE